MSEVDVELLVTMDDPGEDTLEEDTFHLQADNTSARWSAASTKWRPDQKRN